MLLDVVARLLIVRVVWAWAPLTQSGNVPVRTGTLLLHAPRSRLWPRPNSYARS
jgi:hypothetical protein